LTCCPRRRQRQATNAGDRQQLNPVASAGREPGAISHLDAHDAQLNRTRAARVAGSMQFGRRGNESHCPTRAAFCKCAAQSLHDDKPRTKSARGKFSSAYVSLKRVMCRSNGKSTPRPQRGVTRPADPSLNQSDTASAIKSTTARRLPKKCVRHHKPQTLVPEQLKATPKRIGMRRAPVKDAMKRFLLGDWPHLNRIEANQEPDT
jgi:hypothetical protein